MLNKLYESDQFRKDVKEFTDRIKTIDSQEKRSRAFGMLDNIRDLVLEIDKAHSIDSGFIHNIKLIAEQKEMLASLRSGLDLYIKDSLTS